MKKAISILLSLVLLVSLFSLLGTFTATAKTYEVKTSKTLVHLTFEDDAPHGIPVMRNANVTYDTENGYLKMSNSGLSNHTAFIGIDGTVGATPLSQSSTDNYDELTEAQKNAYNNLFKFEAGKTYRFSYDFKYLAGTKGSTRTPGHLVLHNPVLKTADTFQKRDITTRPTVTVTKSSVSGASWTPVDDVLTEDTEWKTNYYEFTVGADDEGFVFGVNPGQRRGNSGGIIDAETYIAFDNIKIEEVDGVSHSYTESAVHTMDALDNNFIVGSGCTVTKGYEDSEMGEVLKIVGSGSARGGYSDLKIQKNKKYYIHFDARADVADTQPVFVIGKNGTDTGSRRHFITGFNYKDYGTEIYVDGIKVNASSVKYSTEWQSFGLIIDTSDEALLNNIKGYQADFWNSGIYFLFGVKDGTAYFDNLQLIEVDGLSNAVPTTDSASPAYSIRTEKLAADNNGVYRSAGLRFRGTVSNEVKATADEIGVMVIPSSFACKDADWYDLAKGANSNVKKAVWYEKDVKDLVYSYAADSTAYQLILTGLSSEDGKKLLDRRFAAVMYVKSGDTYTYYSLGETSYSETKAKYLVKNVPLENNNTTAKKELKVLMIGNSFCYNYVEELYGMAAAAGYDLTLGNLYYAGCFINNHWQWLNDNTPNYELYITDKNGRRKTDIKTFQPSLDLIDWDVITLQQHMSLSLMPKYETVWDSVNPNAKNLYDHIKKNNPNADLYWHETWAHEVGFDGFGYTMPNEEYQATVATIIKQVSEDVCEQNAVPMIPSGDAWAIARKMPVIGDNLCNKQTGNDKYHDGDIGGGQYLNACVWFEVLFGKSCIGNTYVPDYELNAEKRAALQLAAHQAVAEVHGYDYAQ